MRISYWQKSVMENPQLASSNPISRLWQKNRLQKQYAAAHRAAGTAGRRRPRGRGKGGQTIAQKLGGLFQKQAHRSSWAGSALLLMLIMGLMQSCTSMFGGGASGLVASSYLSEDADLTGAGGRLLEDGGRAARISGHL